MDTLTITRPDDWHVHFRDGTALGDTVAATARQFARAIAMPNLRPPVLTTADAAAYRQRMLDALKQSAPELAFDPLMTLYLTDKTPADEIQRARDSGFVHAVKYYPAGATTNSDSGVTALEKAYPAIEAMADCGMPLLLHGEVTDSSADIFDRERIFVDTHLRTLMARFPALKVVLEHITTGEAADFVRSGPATLAATITPHHLLYNRNHLLAGGIRPHLYCLPILKRDTHQQALIAAATSGNPKFFLGTDSAPHARHSKECACGCAGIYSAHIALELYAEVFDRAGALDKLEGFASHFGADFYGLPRNTDRITLKRESQTVPATLTLGNDTLIPLRAGERIDWRISQ
ncbi:MAG TPA: dihydroorotase [Pseudomonadales bacterium]|jgi:dihydroorotase